MAGYADLELDLFHCVNVVQDDFDTVFKSMFGTRGETKRINMAQKLGFQHYQKIDLLDQFEVAICAVRYCLKIRNQYSHCTWWDDYSGKLTFANLEEIASSDKKLMDLQDLTSLYVDVPTLVQQELYFEYADNLLVWVNFEGRS